MVTLDQKQQELDQIKNTLSNAQNLYSQYVTAAPQVPGLVKTALSSKFNDNADLVGQENQAQADLQTTPTDYAANIKTTFNGDPILAGKAAAQREAAIQQKLQNIRGIQQNRTQSFNDIIKSSSDAYNGEVSAAKGAVDNATSAYGIADNEYKTIYGQQQDAQAEKDKQAAVEEQKRQFGISEANQNARAQVSNNNTTKATLDKVAAVVKAYKVTPQVVTKATLQPGQKVGQVTGLSFSDDNGQPISVGKYVNDIQQVRGAYLQAGIPANEIPVQDVNLKTVLGSSNNPGDKQIAAQIQQMEDQKIPEAQAMQTLQKQYPWIFNGLTQ